MSEFSIKPTFLMEIEGDSLRITCNIPPDTNPERVGVFLYRLNKGEFSQLLLESIVKACQDGNKMEIAEAVLGEFQQLYKSNRPAVRPLMVFKQKE